MNCPATFAHMPHDDCDGKQDAPLTPTTYRPQLERVCPCCGSKYVGRCPLNSCNARE